MLESKRIVLGVAGGIAAYKAVDLASRLVQERALVDVIMTESAQKFVAPLTFAALTRRTVHTNIFTDWLGEDTGHVGLARNADLFVVAPATAHTLARLALGFSDDLLSAVYLSTRAPVLLVPAMETGMYLHPATQEHLDTLIARGAVSMQPVTGRLASGATGIGRMPDLADILAMVQRTLARHGPLAGKQVVVTAGGTQEPLDPVRYVGNRSSGKMGYAIAEAAWFAGADVVLISGPATAQPPHGMSVTWVGTAREMEKAVREAVPTADALVMAAAVADYAPGEVAKHKIKKSDEELVLKLERTPDILAEVAEMELPGLVRVGFAAESERLVENAREKLRRKKLDLVVANDAATSLGADESRLTLIFKDGVVEEMPPLPKTESAKRLVEHLIDLIGARQGLPALEGSH